MKTHSATTLIFLNLATSMLANGTIANPLTDFTAQFGLSPSDKVVKIEADITGDGRPDILSEYVDPNPGIEERRVAAAGDKRIWWISYIKNQDGTYIKTTGVDLGDGEVGLGTDIGFDLQEVYVGQVSEIDRFAVVAREKITPRRTEATSTLLAYTWEGDHFKCRKLGEFETGQQNALYDKYLAEGKRTVLQVQQVAP